MSLLSKKIGSKKFRAFKMFYLHRKSEIHKLTGVTELDQNLFGYSNLTRKSYVYYVHILEHNKNVLIKKTKEEIHQ